jgi:hypothetical protein
MELQVAGSIKKPLRIFKAAEVYSKKNNKSSSKSKHIGIKFLVVKGRVYSLHESIE